MHLLVIAAVANACALLTAADIASVQGEKPARFRESRRQSIASRCVIPLPTAAKSVTVEVTTGAGTMELVKRMRVAAETEGDEAGEQDDAVIALVPGIGDEAFWAEGVHEGALYVRRGQTLLRILLGGDESKEARLKKLRLLADKALSRLPK